MKLRKLAAMVILGALLSAPPALAGGGGERGASNPKGVIEYLEGDVLVDGSRAEIGQEIAPGASVQTGDASTCTIVFGGRNVFRIEERSEAILEIDGTRGSIRLDRGGLAAVFEKLQTLGSSGGTFRIQTPTAVAGVRGTAFYIKVEDRANTYVCTCNGVMGIEDAEQRSSRTVRAEHHSAFRFTRESDGIRVSPAEMLYHGDETMDLLAVRIGARIPWGR